MPGDILFAKYGEPARPEIFAWLPLLTGTLAAIATAGALCPVPRTNLLTASQAIAISITYLLALVAIATTVLLAVCRLPLGIRDARTVWPTYCAAIAWTAPTVAFLARRSAWAVIFSVVLAMQTARLLRQWYCEIAEPDANARQLADPRANIFPMVLAAFLFQLGIVAHAEAGARTAALCIATSFFIVCTRYISGTPHRALKVASWRTAVAVALAFLFTAASFTPYLMRDRNSPHDAGFFSQVWIFWNAFRGGGPPLPHRGASQGRPPYAALQALFGDPVPAPPPRPGRPPERVVIAGKSYSGMILRPELQDHVTLVPPPPSHRVFGAQRFSKSADSLTIPFYGAYWLYRASEGRLPPDAVEARGDPVSTEFRSTDMSPIVMEARQNFGVSIALSCCQAIELHLTNGDRGPNTISIELILRNTRLPKQPRLSLGIQPINSTPRTTTSASHPPIPAVLPFRIPPTASITEFDEAIIRYHMRYRFGRSARIGVERFRLIRAL